MHAVCCAGTNAKRALAQDERDFHPRPTKFHALLGRLLPAALRLAASAEPVARKLFGQLVPALVHWLTRSARTCGPRSASPAPTMLTLSLCTAGIPVFMLFFFSCKKRYVFGIHVNALFWFPCKKEITIIQGILHATNHVLVRAFYQGGCGDHGAP